MKLVFGGSINKNNKITHLTIVILTSNGYLFSFGTELHKDGRFLISTPDNLFESKILDQINKPNYNFIKLIAKHKINKINYNNIYNIFNSLKITDFITCSRIYSFTYNNINKNSIEEFNLYTFFLTYNNVKYCRYASSRKSNQTMNCASFVEKILGDIITCTGSSLVTNPNWCYQRSTIKTIPCYCPSNRKFTKKLTNIN
jgi:hypothetical protein